MSEFRLICADAVSGLRQLPDESVHCCVTSPPYWNLRDYGIRGQIGLEPTPEEYVAHVVEVFAEVHRVLRRDGTVWLNLGDSFANDRKWGGKSGRKNYTSDMGRYPRHKIATGLKGEDLVGIPWRVAFALQTAGWWLRMDVIWAKANPMPESVLDRPTKAHEYIFLLSKSEKYFYDREAILEPLATDPAENYPARRGSSFRNGKTAATKPASGHGAVGQGERYIHAGRNKRSVWTVASEPFAEAHFAVFPTALVEPCILAGTSEVGCCPECGAPWRRVVQRSSMVIARSGRREAMGEQGRTASSGTMVRPAESSTVGWRASCSHEGTPVPCTVLDPFAGSGTTGLVALRHGRAFLGIELNPEYVQMAQRRITAEAPLLYREASA